MVFSALRDIVAGEELFLDCSLEVGRAADPNAFGCACGAKECRDTMLAATLLTQWSGRR